MTEIILTTIINATAEKCFNLSLDVNLHLQSAEKTKERVIAGRTSGLFELNEEVTWEAVHFGIKQQLTVKIIKLDRPHFFADEMQKGAFKSMLHEHHFEEKNGSTLMKDIFRYEVPFGFIGRIFDKLILKNYMTGFLLERNRLIKNSAESNQ